MNEKIEVVFGAAVPTDENTVEMPPKKASRKNIEPGEIELKLEDNTPEIIAKLNNKEEER